MQINSTSNRKQRIFVDMDGTLAEWKNIKVNLDTMEDSVPTARVAFSIEEQVNKILYSPEYFFTLKLSITFKN